MKKKKSSFMAVYLVTIIVTLVLLGGTAIIVYKQFVAKPEKIKVESSSSDDILFTPDEEQNLTTLYILEGGDTEVDDVFLLTRFLPVEGKFICIPILGSTYSQINTTKSTVYEFYRTGGSLKAVEAVENATNVHIQKYMKFNKDAFNALVDILGGVNFTVPYDLIYDNKTTGESVVLKQGYQPLDGIRLRWLFTFPEFAEGEEYRAKMIGSAITEMLNQALSERLANTIDNSFTNIINSVDTNVTAYDYNFRKDAILYLIQPGTTPAQFKITTGEFNDKKQYVLDDTFKDDLLFWFDVEPIIET